MVIDLKITTRDDCRLRTNALPGEEGFNQVWRGENIPQELLRYLKQQNPFDRPTSSSHSGMDSTLSRSDLREDERASTAAKKIHRLRENLKAVLINTQKGRRKLTVSNKNASVYFPSEDKD